MPELARLTWPEAADALERTRLALVPVGSCEQHGPHLTLDTDIAIATAFARRLADDLGLSEHHLGFPGTLTLRPDTFVGFISDVAESLSHEIETSVAMVLAPDSLHADRISEPQPAGTAQRFTDPPRAVVDRPTWFGEWTENGALGDPRLASAEIGARVVDLAYRRALEFVRQFAEDPLP